MSMILYTLQKAKWDSEKKETSTVILLFYYMTGLNRFDCVITPGSVHLVEIS
jgi:hypothetical protein